MNYTKSEFYRIFITKEIYAAAGLLAGIALLLNVALYYFRKFLCKHFFFLFQSGGKSYGFCLYGNDHSLPFL